MAEHVPEKRLFILLSYIIKTKRGNTNKNYVTRPARPWITFSFATVLSLTEKSVKYVFSGKGTASSMRIKKWIIILATLTLMTSAWFGYDFYRKFFRPNINVNGVKKELFIPSGSTFEDVMQLLRKSGMVVHMDDLEWIARRMNYPAHVNPGRYIIRPDMTNRELIMLLRSAAQTPVRVTLNKVRTKQALAGFVSKKLEADSAQLVSLLNDSTFVASMGLTTDNVMVIFLHNTYEFYWNTDAQEFVERMWQEYQRYWNEKRITQAQRHGLTPITATILASIVEEETNIKSEKPIIAGVYLNRLKKNMKLQADPTVRFALNNFAIKRLLLSHLNIDSPYNTYLYEGLPPGPICTPSPSSLEAVLSPAKHDYYFFCAKEDFSGSHYFARTHAEHVLNARKFHQALNENQIF